MKATEQLINFTGRKMYTIASRPTLNVIHQSCNCSSITVTRCFASKTHHWLAAEVILDAEHEALAEHLTERHIVALLALEHFLLATTRNNINNSKQQFKTL